MATRYYPSVKSLNAIIRGRANGDWDNGTFNNYWYPDQVCWELMTTKVDAGTQTITPLKTNQQGNYDILWATWVSRPLQAQTISGTFNLCFGVNASWITLTEQLDLSVVRYKVHVYIAVGDTKTVRHTLLDNYVDPVDFPFKYGLYLYVYKSLQSAQSLISGNAQAGDRIHIEIGVRVVSSPTPTPTYPPTENTHVDLHSTGANVAYTDAVDGDHSPAARASWFEFSANITEQALPSPPSNDACADAIVIPSIPYTSPFIDTSNSQDTERRIWFKFTAPKDGRIFVTAHGSNYKAELVILDGCGGFAEPAEQSSTSYSAPRAQGLRAIQVTTGVDYWIRVASYPPNSACAPNSGGIARINVFYQEAPVKGDVYLPSGTVFALRDDQYVNVTNSLDPYTPTGVAIDYTKRTMEDLNGGTNSNERILIGLFTYEIVEILDLPSFNIGQSEVDYISDPFAGQNTSQLIVTSAGILHVSWTGNGYLFVCGSGALPAVLNTVSNSASLSALRSIDAIKGDNQLGAPFSDTERILAVEVTAPWAVALDENTGIMYYTSGGFYQPVGGQIIKRYNINTDTQLSDFATLTLQGTYNPGLKGLAVIATGGLLVCNGPVVQRLNSSGTVIQTYTPSIAIDSECLVDVELDADQTTFWTVDLATTRLFQFNLATGAELQTVQPYGVMGTLTQLAVYTAGEEPPPPEDVGTLQVIKTVIPPEDTTVFEVNVGGGLTPATINLGHGESEFYGDVPVGDGYSVQETSQTGWSIRYLVSNGSPVNNISVGPDENVVVTITNTKNIGGIYILVPGKRDDTVWTSFNPLTETDVKIPNPFIKTALLGE